MANVKPLYDNQGTLQEMSTADQLPVQPDIDTIYRALSLMVFELTQMGIQFQNPEINNLLNNL